LKILDFFAALAMTRLKRFAVGPPIVRASQGRRNALSDCPASVGRRLRAVSVPGLPGCWSQGSTEAEAIENAKDAIRDYLAVVDQLLQGEQIREIEVSP
jgi:hypothetical protein